MGRGVEPAPAPSRASTSGARSTTRPTRSERRAPAVRLPSAWQPSTASDRRDRRHGRRSRRAGARRRGRGDRLRLDSGALPQLRHAGDLARGRDRAVRDRDGDRVGVHALPVHPRGHRARHRRDVRRALPARPRRRRQAPERDLARGRVRPPRAAPAGDDRGGAPDHGSKAAHRRADPVRGRVLRHRHQGLGPPPQAGSRVGADLHRGGAARGWRGWRATSPTG